MLSWLRRKPKEKAPAPRVNLTPAAYHQLAAVLSRQEQAAALRILVKNPGAGAPQYDMALEPANMRRPGDTLIDVDGLRILVDAQSMPSVDGATVDFRDDPLQPGFIVQTPPFDVPSAFGGAHPL